MSRLGIEFREGIEISKRQNAAATFRLTSLLTLMILAFFCACTAHGAWRVNIERGQCAHVERQGNRAVWRLQAERVLRASYVCAVDPVLPRSTAYSGLVHSRTPARLPQTFARLTNHATSWRASASSRGAEPHTQPRKFDPKSEISKTRFGGFLGGGVQPCSLWPRERNQYPLLYSR